MRYEPNTEAAPPRPTVARPGSLPVVGTTVQCPPDCGQPAFTGRITFVGPDICTNILGIDYVWCSVRKLDGTSGGVWPSHRLGYRISREAA